MNPEWRSSIRACVAAVTGREVSITEIARQSIEQIERLDAGIKAFTFVDPELVLARAAELDQRLARDETVGTLPGVTVGVKDLFDVEGLPTSAGSDSFEPYLASSDSTSVARLRKAGALIVGKTRTSELAWVIPTPPTVNPRNPDLISGGSSGGSAAAVGAGMVHTALGNDVGGSIRIPAALCGVVALKPTYGVVSMAGVLPGAGTLDTAGPLAGSVADVRAVLHEVVGYDAGYVGSAEARLVSPLTARLTHRRPLRLENLRLGTITDPLFEIIDPRARASHEQVLGRLQERGVTLVPLRFPEAELVEPIFWTLAPTEGAALHTEKLREHGDRMGDETRRILHFAHSIPAVLAVRAQQARRQVIEAVARLFHDSGIDAVVAPGSTAPAIPTDELETAFDRQNGGRELALWSYGRVFWLANLTGQPSLVIPTVKTSPPLAVQLVGRPFRDDHLLDVGETVEEILPLENGG